MWDWTGHMGGWWWVMAPLMVAFWVLLIWGVVTLVRRDRNAASRAETLLDERLAGGDIDEIEYRRRRSLIRS